MAAASLVYGLAWGFTTRPMGDSAQYRADGITITSGWHQLTDRTPGYPLLLWATGSLHGETRLLFILQLLLHGASVLLSVDIARRVGVGRTGQLVVAALMMTLPAMLPVVYSGSEAFTQALVTMAFWFITRWSGDRRPGWCWAAGAAAGATAWVRPSYAVLFVPLAVAVAAGGDSARRRVRFQRAGRVAAPAVVAVAALLAISAVRFDSPTLTPLTGWYLSSRTSGYVQDLPERYEPGRSILIAERDRQLLLGDEVDAPNYAFAVRDELEDAMGMDRHELDRWMLRANLLLVSRHPFEYQAAVTQASVRYVAMDSQPAVGGLGRPVTWTLLLVHLSLQGAFVGLFLLLPGLMLTGRVRAPALAVVGTAMAVSLTVALVAVATETGTPRLRAPTEPLLAVALVTGWSLVWPFLPRCRQTAQDCIGPGEAVVAP